MLQQFRQLGNVGRDPPGLVTGKELRRRVPARLLLEIDVREGLARMILHDETGVRFFDRPGRRGSGAGLPNIPLAAPILFCFASHCRRRRVLDLDPAIGPAGAVWGAEPLRHNALAAEPASVLVVVGAIALKILIEGNSQWGLRSRLASVRLRVSIES